MNLLKNPVTILVLRLILGVMLLYACFDKIAHPAEFAKIINNYRLLPYSLTNLMAIYLPWVELYVGMCLILGIFVDGASMLTMLMMGMFVIALSQAIIRGIDIQCGCYKVTSESSKVGFRRVIEDIIYFGMAFLIYNRRDRKFELYPKSF